MPLPTKQIHPSWQPLVTRALSSMHPTYLQALEQDPKWLPGPEKIFNAFQEPLDKVQYILFGESPYPRAESAIGYAFWDGRVTDIWHEKGLSKTVNRATSLRNLIKMLLVTHGYLARDNTSQEAIARLDKTEFVQTLPELFGNLIGNGFLLLNASLVLSQGPVPKEVRAWRPFMETLLQDLAQVKPHIQLILLGNLAKTLESYLPENAFKRIKAEHPYNISFIQNTTMQDLFLPLQILANPKDAPKGGKEVTMDEK